MTRIEAIIRPAKLDELRAALACNPWIAGLTVGEVKGYRGGEYTIEFLPKVKVEIIVPDPLVPRILHELESAMRTGLIGDGKIFVSSLDEVVRIRTGERGEGAL